MTTSRRNGAGKASHQPVAPAPEQRAATGTTQTPERDGTKRLDLELNTFRVEFKNLRGPLGTAEPYNLGDFRTLLGNVQGRLQDYAPLTVADVDVKTALASIHSYDGLRTYYPPEEVLKVGSQVRLASEDGSLEALLFVGQTPDLRYCRGEIKEGRYFAECAGRFAPVLAKEAAIWLGTSLVGGAIFGVGRAFRTLRFAGKAIRAGGALYAMGDGIRQFYNQGLNDGFCTLELRQGTAAPTPGQVKAYRNLVQQYGA